jgi:hypothetical protein
VTLVRRRVAGRRDEGTSTLEVLGFAPIAVLIILVVLQVIAFTMTVTAANQAVRDGARAMSLGRSAEVAIERSLPDNLSASRITYPAGAVRIEVRVPRIAIMPQLTVERQATMPRTVP